jgi:hypothetical protein
VIRKVKQHAGHVQFQYTYHLYVHPSEEEMREEWEQAETNLQLSHSARREEV